MSEILFYYHGVDPTTWAYLSSLLTVALFFKFSRVWSVRNVDLIGLILLAPGLLCVEYGAYFERLDTNNDGQITRNEVPERQRERFAGFFNRMDRDGDQIITRDALDAAKQVGYIWLFCTAGFFLIRLLLDPLMVRRPLLEPNLSAGGLTFLGVSLLVFLMANVVTNQPDIDDLAAASSANVEQQEQDTAEGEQSSDERFATRGPGYALLQVIPNISTRIFVRPGDAVASADGVQQDLQRVATARTMAILSHLAIVLGMVLIGYRHFDNIRTGIAAAVLYLMLPYTAIMTGRVTHVLPAALLVWAVAAYRRPLISGMLMGLAIGTSYYPLFLLPLWVAFYFQRGLVRFGAGVISMLAVLTGVLALNAANADEFLTQVQYMFGFIFPTRDPQGFWGLEFNDPVYRIPVLAAFVAMCGTLAIWPAQKNLGTLLSCSAAVMLGTQFWNAYGGLYMAWYLPLLLLTIFRPNLEDRVALSVLGEWRPKRRLRIAPVGRAA
jgi:hypothetical protein